MDKPSSTLEQIYDLINSRVSEEIYLAKRSDKAGKSSYDWPELELLKRDINLFREYLLTFSVEGRNQILLKNQVLGMSQASLYERYKIAKDSLRILKGQHQPIQSNTKAEIRYIKSSQSISNELFATIAIFSRVPLTWIQHKNPKQSWTVEHFEYLSNASLSLEEFYEYLTRTEKNALVYNESKKHTRPNSLWIYDIRGIILKLSNSHDIYLRVAIYEKGGFLIEVFSDRNEIYDYIVLKKLLSKFGPIETGYLETVIKKRVNPVIICKSLSYELHLPVNLKSF
ncbi:hypothetical protein [Robertmurraya siralis]|uniref:hypothetical protein n=1 Tax=Robertmurraya siralis TaxID=77777 RepID=UPI000BA7D787|nr:hypothetical protein [Robertmurraya siralis]PAE18295.1 hypothetical protein CHH80_22440 [Bacillus sp. 7504-2]